MAPGIELEEFPLWEKFPSMKFQSLKEFSGDWAHHPELMGRGGFFFFRKEHGESGC